jgi:O-methyltransferase
MSAGPVARVRTLAKSVAEGLGFEVRRSLRRSEEWVAAERAPDSEYYRRWVSPHPLFSPWAGHPDFAALYEGVEEHTVVPPERCYTLAALAQYASNLGGDAAECGVYRGGTALLLCRAFLPGGGRLRLFDSFEGLPVPDPAKDPAFFQQGEYAAESVEAVERLLEPFRAGVDIHKGWIPGSFAGLDDRRYALAHIDVDLYQSALDCCEYFYPRLVPGAVMVFDEYGFAPAHGERDAVDEFFADKPESPIVLATGQAMVIRLPDAGDATR